MKGHTIVEVFERQASLTPENIALVSESVRLTYRELNRVANKVSRSLDEELLGRSKGVGILIIERGHLEIIGIIATLKLGCPYVPIEPSQPQSRIQRMITDIGTAFILTEQKFHGFVLKITERIGRSDIPAPPVFFIDSMEHFNCNSPGIDLNPNHIVSPDDLANIIFTSGTTGSPKGVMIEHRSFLATLRSIRERYFTQRESLSTYSITSYAFDIFGLEYGLSLLTGGTFTIGNIDFPSLDCRGLAFVQFTPSVLAIKLEALRNTEDTLFIVGGERLTDALLTAAMAKGFRILHVYGPTETTIWTTGKLYSPSSETRAHEVYLGTEFDGEKIHLLNSNYEPVANGDTGEIFITGIGLARGYLGDAQLTEDAFLNLYLDESSEMATRAYKTGDFARRNANNELEFVGRLDSQVKVAGHRIELKEIDNCILEVAGIRESVTVVRDFQNGAVPSHEDKRLISYFTTDIDISTRAILEHLRERLPSYMIPFGLVQLEKMPLTSNGKLALSSLPDVKSSFHNLYEPASDAVQSEMVTLWSRLLKLPKESIGVHDDFFNLGGTSLLALELVSRLRTILKVHIPLQNLFANPTIANLSHLCKSPACILTSSGTIAARYDGTLAPIANRHSYFLKRTRNLHFWNSVDVIKFTHVLDSGVFVDSVQGLLDHHPSLGLSVHVRAGSLEERIGRLDPKTCFVALHTSASSTRDAIENLIEAAQNEFRFPDRLLKIALVSDGAESHVVLVFHHILVDAFSTRILIRNLFELYGQLESGVATPSLVPETTPLWDYSTWAIAHWEGESRRFAMEYWRDRPWGEVHSVPMDFPVLDDSNQELFTTYSIERIPLKSLTLHGGGLKPQFISLLLCSIGMAYCQWTGQECLNLALVVLGRENFSSDVDLSNTVGWISETVPILLRPQRNLMSYLEDINLQMDFIRRNGKSFGIFKYCMTNKQLGNEFAKYPEPEISLNIVADLGLNNLLAKHGGTSVSGIRFTENIGDTERVFKISGGVFVEDTNLVLSWDYSRRLFKAPSIDKFNSTCATTLLELSKSPPK